MQAFWYILIILLTEASHRKLLLKMEETVETQLNDAQRRITAIHEASFVMLFIYKNYDWVSYCSKHNVIKIMCGKSIWKIVT
jgi:hypothetical protein